MMKVDPKEKAEVYREDFDPGEVEYKKTGRNRRKFDDPNYKGPERRLGRRRKKEVDQILSTLQKALGEWE